MRADIEITYLPSILYTGAKCRGLYLCMCVCVCACTCTCACAYACACAHVHVYVYVCICRCRCRCMCVHVYVYVYVYAYAYVYVYAHILSRSPFVISCEKLATCIRTLQAITPLAASKPWEIVSMAIGIQILRTVSYTLHATHSVYYISSLRVPCILISGEISRTTISFLCTKWEDIW